MLKPPTEIYQQYTPPTRRTANITPLNAAQLDLDDSPPLGDYIRFEPVKRKGFEYVVHDVPLRNEFLRAEENVSLANEGMKVQFSDKTLERFGEKTKLISELVKIGANIQDAKKSVEGGMKDVIALLANTGMDVNSITQWMLSYMRKYTSDIVSSLEEEVEVSGEEKGSQLELMERIITQLENAGVDIKAIEKNVYKMYNTQINSYLEAAENVSDKISVPQPDGSVLVVQIDGNDNKYLVGVGGGPVGFSSLNNLKKGQRLNLVGRYIYYV